MPRAFGQDLADAITAAGMTKAQFARAAGCTKSLVTDVVCGRRKVPLAQAERWAAVLHAAVRDRLAFVRAAAVDHCPPVVQEWIRELTAKR